MKKLFILTIIASLVGCSARLDIYRSTSNNFSRLCNTDTIRTTLTETDGTVTLTATCVKRNL